MKRTTAAISILFAIALFASCGHDDADSHSHDTDSHASHSASTTAEKGLDGLELNNGNKWEMDDHTRSVFAEMAASFLGSDHASLQEDGLKKAGSDLQAHIKNLVQGCTMTGEAHDQLHVFLAGYIPAVKALSELGRIEDAKEVAHYLEKYDEYFE